MLIGKAPPAGSSYQTIDGRWVLGVASGANRSFQNGITAHAGGTKAAALQLPANVQFFEVDTVTTGGDSVLLPAAKQGQWITLFNNGASSMNVYGRGTDTINQSATATAFALAAGKAVIFTCAKDGSWSGNLSA